MADPSVDPGLDHTESIRTSMTHAPDASGEATGLGGVPDGDTEIAPQANVAATPVVMEDNVGDVPNNSELAAEPTASGEQPDYGYGHPAHRPDPNARYTFDPGPSRLLPVGPEQRWRVPG